MDYRTSLTTNRLTMDGLVTPSIDYRSSHLQKRRTNTPVSSSYLRPPPTNAKAAASGRQGSPNSLAKISHRVSSPQQSRTLDDQDANHVAADKYGASSH